MEKSEKHLLAIAVLSKSLTGCQVYGCQVYGFQTFHTMTKEKKLETNGNAIT